MRYYGCDAHKRYSVFSSMDEKGHSGPCVRVDNHRLNFRQFLRSFPPGSQVALESVGNWYWMIDEIERAGHIPKLTHARKAKLMMGQVNKTDKLDARGLTLLMYNGTLPSVWIPPGELRDQRELTRMRVALVRTRTMYKNRIHAALSKYAVEIPETKNIFGVLGRKLLDKKLSELPYQTRRCVESQLQLLDQVKAHIGECEKQIEIIIEQSPNMVLLMTMPGVGRILSTIFALEIGDVNRFAGPQKLASYAGTVPRIKSSGGRTTYGKVRSDVNRYLKWALVEAANVVVINQSRWPHRHVVRLYKRIRQHKGHAKAVVAVARHLAEAAYCMLKRQESYKEPNGDPTSSTQKQARFSHEN